MKELLVKLARARYQEELATQSRKTFEARFRESPDFQLLLQIEAQTKAITALAENIVREAAQAQYDTDMIKKPDVGGYEIKTSSVVAIQDEQAAREWCFTNFRPALKLDVKSFEKAAKDGNIPAELALVYDEPKVFIKSCLDDFLKAEEADPLVA